MSTGSITPRFGELAGDLAARQGVDDETDVAVAGEPSREIEAGSTGGDQDGCRKE
jgi:hypothetical protein